MEITEQAIQSIVKLADDRRRPTFVKHPHDSALAYAVDSEGKMDPTPIIAPRRHSALSVPGLCSIVSDLQQRYEEAHARIFVGDDKVTAVLDDGGTRRDVVELTLTIDPGFATLIKWECSPNGLEQAELVWILRSQFRNAYRPESFLPTLRSLKFNSGKQGTSGVQHGRETVDLSVERALTGDGGKSLDEEVQLRSAVYQELSADGVEGWEVLCAVNIDIEVRRFVLRPANGEITRVRALAREYITKQIGESLAAHERVLVYPDAVA